MIAWSGRRVGMVLGLALLGIAASGHADPRDVLLEDLRERYTRSYVELQSAPGGGRVFGRGAVLLLQADGMPANPFRLAQLDTKSPHFHVRDFAAVEIHETRWAVARPGSLVLARGIRLVVLDVNVGADRVQLLTHTLELITGPGGRGVHGCTEFIFRFDAAVLDRGDVGTVERQIDEWMPIAEARGGG